MPLQQALRHLQGAFTNFWEKRAKYPTFKSQAALAAVGGVHPVGVPLARRRADAGEDGRAAGHPRGRGPLPDGAEPSTVTVSRDAAGRWHVSLLCEVTVQDGPPTDAVVGIDAGDHVAGHPVHRGEGHQPAARAPRPGRGWPGRNAVLARKQQRVGEPGEGPPAAWPGCTPGSPTGAATTCTS